MALLFSKVDLNKLWHDLQNKETLICAKFGKDLFNISEVIGRKKVAQFFWLTVYIRAMYVYKLRRHVKKRFPSPLLSPIAASAELSFAI